MRNRTKFLFFASIILLVISSCCHDNEYWFPDEAVRYYNDHDTIKFYCPETDKYEVYPVCGTDTTVRVEPYYGLCDYTDSFYGKQYELYRDSCESTKKILVLVKYSVQDDIIVSVSESENNVFYNTANFGKTQKITIDVLGHTYKDAIRIPGTEWGDIISLVFSYEYGIIQMQYADQTLSLINDEN